MNTVRSRGKVQELWAEERVAAGLAQADPAAREAFVELAHDAVYAFACRLTRDVDRRGDWVHDTLLRIMDDVHQGAFVYHRPGAFWAWFRKRAWFLVLEARRRQSLHDRRESLTPEGDLPDRAAVDDTSRSIEESEAAEAVERCLAALGNADHRRALRLRLMGEPAYEEIADALDVPLNTVRAWIRRGRIALRRCLATRFGWDLPEEES